MDEPCSFSTICHSGPCQSRCLLALGSGVAASPTISTLWFPGHRCTHCDVSRPQAWGCLAQGLRSDQLVTRAAGVGGPPRESF